MSESNRRSSCLTRLGSAVLAVYVIAPGTAHAQGPSQEYLLIGASVRSQPAYDGSASQRAAAIPSLRYYGRSWFLRTTQGILEGGVRRALTPGLALGVQLAYEAGRRASESSFLEAHRVPDIGPWASIGVHLEWDHKLGAMPINLLIRARQFANTDRGAQTDVRFTAGIYGTKRASAGVFAHTSWANAKSARTYYGVTTQASALTGLPAFEPGRGPLFTSVGALGLVELRPHWVAVWSLEVRHLQGDAAGSPLTERATNDYATVGLAYRF